MTYLLSRLQSRFCVLEGYLFFHQNFVLTSNLDRQTVYLLMLYLNHMISDYENGFLELPFKSFYLPPRDSRLDIHVYHRQGQILVLLVQKGAQVDRDQMKIFLDKNLALKTNETSDQMAKDQIHYFVCNDTNGISNENMFTYR